MKTGFVALALAACLALTGCFTSETPLFDARRGEAVFGTGRVMVTTYKEGETPDTGNLQWANGAYAETGEGDDGVISFHHLPGAGWFSPWLVGQTQMGEPGDATGYIYMLYRKEGKKLFTYDLSCSDLTPAEAAETHMARSGSDQECKVTRAADLGKAFLLLSKRKPAEGYMAAAPAK